MYRGQEIERIYSVSCFFLVCFVLFLDLYEQITYTEIRLLRYYKNHIGGRFMIFDISDGTFRRIFQDKCLFLPKRWNGVDFKNELEELFQRYMKNLEENGIPNEICQEVRIITNGIIESVDEYYNGYPEKSYKCFSPLMNSLVKKPLYSSFSQKKEEKSLTLFRAAKVNDNKPYPRDRLFHTPYNLRSKISTSRYSIAGFPCLYLSTSLELCCDEIKAIPQIDMIIASAFQNDIADLSFINMTVIDLAIKPQDLVPEDNYVYNEEGYKEKGRFIDPYILYEAEKRYYYLLWYPIIAASSYIRVNKQDPFAAEYIIPQLIMQWARTKIREYPKTTQLMGIRYFSCASEKASDMGFNYVFPTSGKLYSKEQQFCQYLVHAFTLTEPVYLHEYDSVLACENYLKRVEHLPIGQKKIIE